MDNLKMLALSVVRICILTGTVWGGAVLLHAGFINASWISLLALSVLLVTSCIVLLITYD